jgi:hypothetical protein
LAKAGGGEKHLEDDRSILKISKKEINKSYLKKWAQILSALEELDEITKNN